MTPLRVRPTALSCDTSSRQVAQTNSTANAWLPGRRQPTWLTSAKPVAPTPRLPQLPRSPVLQLAPPTQGVEPRTKPALATTCDPTAVDVVEGSQSSDLVSLANPQPSVLTVALVLPSPAPSNEASPEATSTQPSAPAADMRSPGYETTLASRNRALPTPAVPPQREITNPPRSHSRSRPILPMPSAFISPNGSAPPITSTTSFDSPVTQLQYASIPTSLPASPIQQTHQREHASVEGVGPPKRRRVLPRDLEFIQSWNALEVLADFARRCGGEQQLDPALEQPRLQLLKDACATGDLFYVVLHQVFCTWTAKPLEIRGLFQNDDRLFSLAEHGLQTLSAILKDNSNMRPDLLQCFANFPAPFPNMQRFPPYSDSLNAVVKFLFSMATSWTELMKKHAAYGFPLLMDELLRVLHMHSDVLQLIVFRASRRTAGVPDGPAGTQMESLFKEDQDFHRSADGSFLPKAQDPAYTNYNDNLIQRYQELAHTARTLYRAMPPYNQHQQQRYVQQSTSPTAVSNNAQGFVGNVPSPAAPNQQWTALPSQTMSVIVEPLHNNPPSVSQGVAARPQESAASMNVASHQFSTTSQAPSPGTVAPTQHALRTEAPGLAWHGQPQRLQSSAEQTHARPNAHVSGSSASQQASFGASSGAHWSSGSPVSAQSPVLPVTGAGRQYPSGSPVVQASTAMGTIHRGQAVQPLQPFVTQPTPTKPISTGLLFPGRNDRIPINEYPSDPQDNNCIMHTLHHAHIRSPKRLPIRPEALNERYYQSVRRLVLGPTSIAPSAVVHKFSFHLGPKDRDRLTHVETDPDGLLPIQRYTNGTARVRIRCCYLLDQQHHKITDSDWVTKDVVWPEHIFLEVNHSGLTLRRKAHHSKDLPVEVPANALLEENHLRVWIPETAARPREAPKNSHPYLAVELVETLSHSSILSLVKTHGIQQSPKTLEVIRRRLSSTTASNDDDIAMVSHELAIDLADPFTSAIFKTPVRGMDCTHLECFDLETWLNSRLGKKKTCTCGKGGSSCQSCPNEPSFVDKWKCPLCSGDARPYSLRIDEWLAGVRDKLKEDGALRAKAILVSADGSWKIKELPREADEEDDGSYNDEPAPSGGAIKRGGNLAAAVAANGAASRSASTPVIIEIDDD